VAEFPGAFAHCTGFQWDDGNSEKNWEQHQVSRAEAEQVFFNRPIVVAADSRHSGDEPRFAALGQTNEGRRLAIIFTIREVTMIRVISARDQSREERKVYAQAQSQE
jgi:uncharacterized DUF497 family protein